MSTQATRIPSFAVVLLLALAGTAPAQSAREPRGYVTFSAGIQPKSSDLSDTFRFDLYAETATADVRYPGKEGVVIDGGFGLKVWKQLGAGVSGSYRPSQSGLSLTGSLPHPFFLDRPRAIEGEMSGITRSETGVHVQALYFLPASGRWRVVLGAGPSYFTIEQELANEIRYADEYPHDEATFRDPTIRNASGSALGFNAGVDVTYQLTRRFGVGGLFRFARASIDLDGPGDRRIGIDAGGLQAGAGVRVVF